MFLASRFLTILKFLLYCAFLQKCHGHLSLYHHLQRVGEVTVDTVQTVACAQIWVLIRGSARFLGSLSFIVWL